MFKIVYKLHKSKNKLGLIYSIYFLRILHFEIPTSVSMAKQSTALEIG